MRRKNLNIFPLIFHGGIILTSCLVAIGMLDLQVSTNRTSKLALAQTPTTAEQLNNSTSEQQNQAEIDRLFNRTLIQFNLIILVTLALLLIGAIATLWLLRRAVIREVSSIVSNNLQELDIARNKLDETTKEVNNILQTARRTETKLNRQAEDFYRELNHQQETITQLLAKLSQSKEQAVNVIESHQKNTYQSLEKLETQFTNQITQLQTKVEQQAEIILQEFTSLSNNLPNQLEVIQKDAEAKKEVIIKNLEESAAKFND